ncbi:putative reverse transcriptase domain-containing protein [Tanacetum coccineum]
MLREVRLCCPAISRWVEFCYSNPARLYIGEHTLWSCQEVQQGDPLGPLLFSLVLHPLICKIRDSFSPSFHAWYLDDGTIVGDTLVVGKVLEVIMEDGSGCGLHLNVDKTEVFWLKEDPRSRLVGIFPPNIARPLHGVKLLCGPASVDFEFCNELVMKRVAKTIGLMDGIAKINDPECDVLNYAFLASRLQSVGLQTKLLRHTGIVSPGSIFDDALSVFNTSMETELLSNPSEIATPKLIKKMADIYFTRVTKSAESIFSLFPQQMALWTSQREDHTSDWLRTIPISGLGQTMNSKTYLCVLCYRLGIPLFSVSKPCSKVFAGDIYGDHDVSCAGIIGPYIPTTVVVPAVPATENSPAIPEHTTEAIHLILTEIGDEIYSIVDACKTAQEMWKAIERLQQGESLNIQDVKTNLFWEFRKLTSHDGETMESYYTRFYKLMNEMIRNNLTVATMQVNVQFLQQLQPEWSRFVTIVKQQHKLDEVSYHKLFDILKQYQKEVNKLRAELIARNANPLALVATAQPNQDPYYQTPKSHKPYAPSSKISIPTRSHATTRNKDKEIVKPITPPSESPSEEDSNPKQAQGDKDMQLLQTPETRM